MQGHFDNHLHLRQIFLDKHPKRVVECGAGKGDCTRLIAALPYPFEFHVISDNKIEGITPEPFWHTGISYEVLEEFEPESLDLVIIDTDHNYWTLRKELNAVAPKMVEGGLIVFHDVEEFYHNTGMAMGYWDGHPYPEKQIQDHVNLGGVGLALIDFLHEQRGYFKLVRWIPEHYGAAVIERKTVTQAIVMMPGNKPVFAPPVAA